MAAPRVLLAGLFHETHSFVRRPTPLADFASLTPDEILHSAGQPTQAAGAMEVAAECGWVPLPGPNLKAAPSGIVEDEVVEAFWDGLKAGLADSPDAVYLDLHGAMVARSFPDVEGEILSRLRAVTDIPVGVALDLHGNITDRMCVPNAVFSAYRHNPHTDTKETAMRAARLLDRLMKTGERAVSVRLQPPLIWPPSGTATVAAPMQPLLDAARRIEAECPEIWDVSVFGGFSFSDIPETGPSFLATTVGDADVARARLQELYDLAMAHREAGLPVRASLEETLDRLQADPPAPGAGPVLLVEPADNIGGGTAGDTTHILRGLTERRMGGAGIALADPEAVAALWGVPNGSRATLPLGGKSGEIGCEPVTLSVTKVSQSDGAFTLEDRNSHAALFGLHQSMGRTVVVRTDEGVTVLLNSRKTPPWDLAQWRSQGIDPEDFALIGIKAAVAHRRAYAPIASAEITVDTPGPCTENLRRLPYRHLRRPIWPLDEIAP